MLWKKMIRDMKNNKGSYLACLVLIIIGLAVFNAFSISNENFQEAKHQLYSDGQFADGFAEINSMPERDLEKLHRIEGIRQVSGRLVKQVRVKDLSNGESIYLRLVSKDLDDTDRLNDSQILWGEEMVSGERDVLLNREFSDAHQLELDDRFQVIINGRVQELSVQGAMINPEFVYIMKDDRDLYPDASRFGIGMVPLETMWNLFPEEQGRVNDLVFSMDAGADYRKVEEELELALETYGVTRIYPRDDHDSHFVLNEEIEILTTMSTFFPVIILTVAAFVLYIILKRLVQQQRGQIGILKAFGYNRREIRSHYLSYSLVLAVVGGAIGSIAGMWAATPITELLFEHFAMPEVYTGFSIAYLIQGIVLCLTVLGIAGYQGCKYALRLDPAEAMRPPAPIIGRNNWLERMKFFTRMLTMQGMMGIRNISRSKSRSAFMMLGICISFSLITFTSSMMLDNMPTFLFHQFTEVESYDARVTFYDPISRNAALQEVEELDRVLRAEPLSEVPVELTHRWREENVMLLGLGKEDTLYRIVDDDGNRILPSKDGLILSERLADNLEVKPGDTITLKSPYLKSTTDEVEVTVIESVPQYLGMNAYMEIEAMEELLEQPAFATSVMVRTDSENDGLLMALSDHYQESEKIYGVDGREEMIKNLEEMWELSRVMFSLFVAIGIVFGFSIIYIASFITLSERSRELASMRVMGMTSREVFSVIGFEQWFLAFFGIILGFPTATALMNAFAAEYSTDMYTMPSGVSLETFGIGLMATIVSISVAQRFALKKVRSLSLVEVLRERE